jgi:hypothetical protein
MLSGPDTLSVSHLLLLSTASDSTVSLSPTWWMFLWVLLHGSHTSPLCHSHWWNHIHFFACNHFTVPQTFLLRTFLICENHWCEATGPGSNEYVGAFRSQLLAVGNGADDQWNVIVTRMKARRTTLGSPVSTLCCCFFSNSTFSFWFLQTELPRPVPDQKPPGQPVNTYLHATYIMYSFKHSRTVSNHVWSPQAIS